MSPGPLRAFLTGTGFLALLLGAAIFLSLLAVPADMMPRWGCLLSVVPGLAYYLAASRRERRRRRALKQPFPAAYRDVLLRRVPLYPQLSEEERHRFEGEIRVFLAEQRLYSLDPEQPLSDEHRVLVAASAATLLLGRPEWRLPTVRDIVVYPGAFAEETYEVHPETGTAGTIGMVHAQGPILLSLPALLQSYPELPPPSASTPAADRAAAPNVGIHEFAHVLDFTFSENLGKAPGIPGLLAPAVQRRWQQQLEHERERLLGGDSVLHPYALKNDAELFAVAVETFFAEPQRLRARHPALYRLLAEFFNQDPAARAAQVAGAGPPLSAYFPWPWFARQARYVA